MTQQRWCVLHSHGHTHADGLTVLGPARTPLPAHTTAFDEDGESERSEPVSEPVSGHAHTPERRRQESVSEPVSEPVSDHESVGSRSDVQSESDSEQDLVKGTVA